MEITSKDGRFSDEIRSTKAEALIAATLARPDVQARIKELGGGQ